MIWIDLNSFWIIKIGQVYYEGLVVYDTILTALIEETGIMKMIIIQNPDKHDDFLFFFYRPIKYEI